MPSHLRLHVQGEGILHDIYRSLVGQFDPSAMDGIEFQTDPCLPNPSIPNYHMYKVIGWYPEHLSAIALFLALHCACYLLTYFAFIYTASIYAVCLLTVILQSYVRRTRHLVAGYYYPRRRKERAVWLYNHILRRRGNFLKFMRRQLRRRQDTNEAIEEVSLVTRLAST